MVILRFVTPLVPADLKEELEDKAEKAGEKVKDVLGGGEGKESPGGEK